MPTTFRRESAPLSDDRERIVVGPTLLQVVSDPTTRTEYAASVRHVLPEAGVASLGTARSPAGIRELVEAGLIRRQPDAVWLRDLAWFVDAWGVRATGRLERLLSEAGRDADVEFVSWRYGRVTVPDGGTWRGSRRYAGRAGEDDERRAPFSRSP